MEKEHERQVELKQLNEDQRKLKEEEHDRMKQRHQEHPKVHHPVCTILCFIPPSKQCLFFWGGGGGLVLDRNHLVYPSVHVL